MKAAEIMTKDVITIDGLATVAEAAKLMQQKQVRALIVDRCHVEDAYGIITATDIVQNVVALEKNPQQVYVCEAMTKPCIVVNPDLAVEYIAHLFTQVGIRIAPVIKNELLGIISVTDILTKSDFLRQTQVQTTRQRLENWVENGSTKSAEQLKTQPSSIYETWCSG